MTNTVNEQIDPCDCATLRAKVEELVHGELDAQEQQTLRAHIDGCDGCKSIEDTLHRLTKAVQRACKEQAPESLREVIMQQLRSNHTN
ncbi:zf-HC2 domain-containing protein [Canibacter zhoujuaniae]|uniref:zf-HC2 domain-containing protein n=1 Tax=Canibacter zhoujuaniae TaxID=2708343 RepID=UPI00142258F1|nr:zf-HC2 domain-containing protein [Canibacter zhoujuaniae]